MGWALCKYGTLETGGWVVVESAFYKFCHVFLIKLSQYDTTDKCPAEINFLMPPNG